MGELWQSINHVDSAEGKTKKLLQGILSIIQLTGCAEDETVSPGVAVIHASLHPRRPAGETTPEDQRETPVLHREGRPGDTDD